MQQRIGYRFKDPELLTLALTHPSMGPGPDASPQNNQRLEFLGDAVLQLVLSDHLYRKFPRVGEGLLTKTRAELVNSATLAEQSRLIGLGNHLLLSKGEEQNGGRARLSTLADVFESFIGAVFLDGGYEAAAEFITSQFVERLDHMDSPTALSNPKGELQEILQSISPEHPHYQQVDVTGPDHDRVFECAVFFRNQEIGRGQGKSKKAAESRAAGEAMERYKSGELNKPTG
jgi:ribonuclease III